MKMLAAGVAGIIGLVLASACGSEDGAQGGPGTGGSGGAGADGGGGTSGTAGAGGSGGSGGSAAEAGCTPSAGEDLPDEDFIDSDCDGIDGNAASGVFVSPDGFDDAAGTLDDPVQSVQHAVELASERGRTVYACNGTYRENFRITAPVSVYGGYDCANGWRRIKDRAVVEPGVGVPLVVEAVSGTVHIERMAFRALDAVAAGTTAQAVGVTDSTDVTFDRVEFLSGKGAPGANGAIGRPGSPTPYVSMPTGANGDATQAECNASNSTSYCTRYAAGGFDQTLGRNCVDSAGGAWVGRGGGGGRGGNVKVAQVATCPGCNSGVTGSPGQYHLGDGQWKDVAAANLGQRGSDGQDGAGPTRGIGAIENGIYMASNSGADGTDAAPGFPGKGGAGGGSCYVTSGVDFCFPDRFYPGSGGGQGGVGGCGGWRATAGGAGGGSIGLVVVNSTVTITFPRFDVADAGPGGNGARGGDGEPGGAPGHGGTGAQSASNTGADGVPGGDGGQGGDGGPGGGGPSIAVLYSGVAPQISDAVYSIGLPGGGGTAVSGADGATGVTGELVNIDDLP